MILLLVALVMMVLWEIREKIAVTSTNAPQLHHRVLAMQLVVTPLETLCATALMVMWGMA